MRELWRKTLALLRSHPILWLPCLCAELLSIALWRLRGVAQDRIFRWAATTHSVLGGDSSSPVLNKAELAKASIAYAPIGISTIFVVICLFVAALVLTSESVSVMQRGEKPALRAVWIAVTARWRGVVTLSAKIFVIYAVCVLAGSLLLVSSKFALAHYPAVAASHIYAIMALALIGSIVWLLMPAAIRVLRSDKEARVSAEARWHAVAFAVVASVAGMAIAASTSRLERTIVVGSRGQSFALATLNALLAIAPDALFLVALSVIAHEETSENPIQESVVLETPPER